ncbi:hypothetical protein OD91_0844 [Lutibacter sp. Hel_I_33_5]|uniref:hypothetical protein n=1 Tax=Lutibacter sp. Hel_I_33_5 TaxID=1566289 RepID=UPI0011AAA88D|nr:hypothetical protein [Lutibacter sp. Hel_I_33_5]TVZ55589.1 hypothetical protein OD91_0844 [Lutibacter sp. Hel_I_33_5]
MKKIEYVLRRLLRNILFLAGFIIVLMPFVPAFKEYVFDAPEKEFAAKEVLIVSLGVLIFTGGIFSNKMVDAIINKFSK